MTDPTPCGPLPEAFDPWTLTLPRTPEEIASERADAVGFLTRDHPEVAPHVAQGFTCDGCARVAVCGLAFDAYNTGGDCLWEK